MSEPLYYAKGGKVWKRPVRATDEDGTTSITMGFLICTLRDGDDSAEAVATLMNRGEVFPDLLEALKKAANRLNALADIALNEQDAKVARQWEDEARAALAKARPSQVEDAR